MLRLSIENTPSLTSGDPIEVVLQEHGLVIGRAAHADWTLPDTRNYISSVHCEIDYREGRYYLTDRSTNGTFINGSPDRLDQPTQLRDGDLVTIGQYEVRVEELGEQGYAAPGVMIAPSAPANVTAPIDWGVGEPVAHAIPAGKFGREPARPLIHSASDPLMGNYTSPGSADPFGLGGGAVAPVTPAAGGDPFGLGSAGSVAPAPPPVSPAGGDPFGLGGVATTAPDPFGISIPVPNAPPGVAYADPFGIAPAGASTPASSDPFGLGGGQPAPVPASAPAPTSDPWAKLNQFGTLDFSPAATPPPAPAPVAVAPPPPPAPVPAASVPVAAPTPAGPAETGLLDRLLAAAGLKRGDIGATTPESAVEICGQLLRQTADGLIRLLDARTRVRHQFGVGAQVTTFQRAGNNPLKWTRSAEQALRQMIAGEPGFLSGSQAVQGAFEDIQAHEMAMIAAMQEAMQATIARFSPEAMKQRISARGWLKSVLPGSREATLWRAYETEFKAFADESEAAYLDLFSKHFKKAYEKTIAAKSGTP